MMNTENTAISKSAISFGWSLALCSILNAVLVIAKEKSKAVADWMQRITGHHWITHVAIIMILFVFFGWFFGRTNTRQESNVGARRVTNIVLSGVIAGVVIILVFYLIAD
jgi:hypothetical protein